MTRTRVDQEEFERYGATPPHFCEVWGLVHHFDQRTLCDCGLEEDHTHADWVASLDRETNLSPDQHVRHVDKH